MRLLSLAARNLARNRRRTAISLVALVVGVGAMVGFRGLINGQQRVILENLVFGQLGAVQVHKQGYLANVQGSPLTLDMADSEELRRAHRLGTRGHRRVAAHRLRRDAVAAGRRGRHGRGGRRQDGLLAAHGRSIRRWSRR